MPDTKPNESDYAYLSQEKMQSGDILLPRPASAHAIVSNSDSISLLETAISLSNKNPLGLISALDTINTLFGTSFKSSAELLLYLINSSPDAKKAAETLLGILGESSGVSIDEIKFYLLWVQIKHELSQLTSDPKINLTNLKNSILHLLPAGKIDDINQAIFNGYYVGHCAIVERVEKSLWIIESSHTHGRIRSVSYDEWLAERKKAGALIWHMRFTDVNGDKICQIAHKYRMLDKRYAIFDSNEIKFNISSNKTSPHTLGNSEYIYCSELVYLCLKESGSTSLDGFHSSKEIPMITPKDLTRLNKCEKIQVPRTQLLEKIAPNTPHESKNGEAIYSNQTKSDVI